MAATTTQPDSARIERFTRPERVLHWVNAGLFGAVMLTGAVLKDIGGLAGTIGNREAVRLIHVYCGLAIPVVFLVILVPRWGRALRRDIERINRWSKADVRWFRSLGRNTKVRLDKFNPGQKLNASFLAAAAVVMLGTGIVMAAGSIFPWLGSLPDNTRTGATFVHDLFALFIWIAVLGHIYLAFSDAEAMQGMLRGRVSTTWARTKRPAWYREQTRDASESNGSTSRTGAPDNSGEP